MEWDGEKVRDRVISKYELKGSKVSMECRRERESLYNFAILVRKINKGE